MRKKAIEEAKSFQEVFPNKTREILMGLSVPVVTGIIGDWIGKMRKGRRVFGTYNNESSLDEENVNG